MATTDMDDYWNDVEVAMEYAHLVAFDGCHKIYLAMDEEQAEWFRKNYNGKDCTDMNFAAPAKVMLEKVREWYGFVSSVQTNHEYPNKGFVSLIPQGADEVYEDEDEDEDEMYV